MAVLINRNANVIELTCRTCLKINKQHFNIYEYFQNERPLSDLIMECTSIEVFKEDGFPVNICNGCLEKLNSAYNFKKMVLQSNIELKKIVEEKKEVGMKEEHNIENNLLEVSSEIYASNQPFAFIDISNLNFSETNCKIMEEKKEVFMKEEHDIVGNSALDVSSDICTSNQSFVSIDVSNSSETSFKEDHTEDVRSYDYVTPVAFENECKVELDLESPDDTKCSSSIMTTDFSINYGNIENSNQSPTIETRKLKVDLNEQGRSHDLVYSNKCNKTLTLRDSLGSRLPTQHRNLPLKCKQCDRQCANKDLLRKHVNTHSLVARFPCDECGKMFKHRGYVKIHKARHKTERPYKCDICNMAFKLLNELRSHQRTHTEREAKYVCEMCDRAFTRGIYLRRHKIIHVSPDSKDFICKTCGKSFGLERSLKRHMKIHNKDNRSMPNKRYVCTYCERDFRYKDVLKNHVLIHTNEKPFSCKMCKKTFRQKGCLTRHMRIHTAETPYVCKLCHTFLLSSRRLMTHMRKMHGKEFHKQVKQKKKDVRLN